MKALTVFARAAGCGLLLVAATTASAAQAPGPRPAAASSDALARAARFYNDGAFDAAIAAATEATGRATGASEAYLLLGRALLERHRANRTPEDLSAAREALRSVDPRTLSDRGRLDLVVGLGEALYLDGQYRSAAALLEPVLEQLGLLTEGPREQVIDWWATAMDRYAQTRPPEERAAVYDGISARMRLHLGRYADSSAASYWLPAAALARGDLELAWDLALAGWVRALLAPGKGESLRADLDRLVAQALIPERVKRLPDEPNTEDAALRFATEWDEAKSRWRP